MATTKKRTYYLYDDGHQSYTSSKREQRHPLQICHAANIKAARNIFSARSLAAAARRADLTGPRTPHAQTVQGDLDGDEAPLVPMTPRVLQVGVAEASEPGCSFSILGVTLFVAAGGHVSVRANGQILVVPVQAMSVSDRLLQEMEPKPHDLQHAARGSECSDQTLDEAMENM